MDVLTTLAGAHPSHYLSRFILDTLYSEAARSSPPRNNLTPSFLLGTLLVVCGTAVRLQCYRTLKDHFTFELTRLKEHKLITEGPYSVVRHPSYTAYTVTTVGGLITLFSEGSWIRRSGWLENMWGNILINAWAVNWASRIVLLFLRAKGEDLVLRETFGERWEEYAKRVPYWFVAGLL